MKLDKTWAIAAIAFVAIAGAAAAKWSDLPATGNVIDRRGEFRDRISAPIVEWWVLPSSLIPSENNHPYPKDSYPPGMLQEEEAWRSAWPKGPKAAGNL